MLNNKDNRIFRSWNYHSWKFDVLKTSIQLFQKTLSKEKQTSHKPRPQGSMGSFKSVFIAAVKRELKKPRRRRRGQRFKNELIFYESRDTLKSFTMFISGQAITKLNLGHIDKSEIKI